MKIHLDVEQYRSRGNKMYELAEYKRKRAEDMMEIMQALEIYETKGLLESLNPTFQDKLHHEIYVVSEGLESFGDFLHSIADQFEENDEEFLRS